MAKITKDRLDEMFAFIGKTPISEHMMEDLAKVFRFYSKRKHKPKPAVLDTPIADIDIPITIHDWHRWNGGKIPIAANTRVTISRRDGGQLVAPAGNLRWDHADDGSDIVFYRVARRAE